jgi:hypothetical protein
MTTAYINRIGTAVPPHDIHAPFTAFASSLLADEKTRAVFERLAERSGIAHRFSFLRAGSIAAARFPARAPAWRATRLMPWCWRCRRSTPWRRWQPRSLI